MFKLLVNRIRSGIAVSSAGLQYHPESGSSTYHMVVGFGRAFERELLEDVIAIGGVILIVRLFS